MRGLTEFAAVFIPALLLVAAAAFITIALKNNLGRPRRPRRHRSSKKRRK